MRDYGRFGGLGDTGGIRQQLAGHVEAERLGLRARAVGVPKEAVARIIKDADDARSAADALRFETERAVFGL
jgi:hypothetical protein